MSWVRDWVCRCGAVSLLSACGGSAPAPPAAPPPAAATVSVPDAPSASAAPLAVAPASPARVFRDNVARARRAAESNGWVLSRRIDIPGHHAALLVYDLSPDKSGGLPAEHFDAVGARPDAVPIGGDSGMIDVSHAKGDALLWNLRGDGARFVVVQLTPCGANCQLPEARVLALDDHDGFSEVEAAPACPTCMSDPDGDGIPEFDVPLVTLDVGGCPRVACGPIYALHVEVDGYESWDGATFAKNLAVFKPLYQQKLAEARKQAKALRATPHKSAVCPTDVLEAAAGAYVYGVLLGERRAVAIKDADAAMAGYSTRPCQATWGMFDAPKPWLKLRADLLAAKLPGLGGQRHLARPAPAPAPAP